MESVFPDGDLIVHGTRKEKAPADRWGCGVRERKRETGPGRQQVQEKEERRARAAELGRGVAGPRERFWATRSRGKAGFRLVSPFFLFFLFPFAKHFPNEI